MGRQQAPPVTPAAPTTAVTPPFLLKKSSTIPLTPELVQSFIALPPSPVERSLSQKRLEHLEGKVKNGLTTSFGWATVECPDPDDPNKVKVYRINGQHSSTMLAQLNGEFPTNGYVHMDEYKVDHVNRMATLFRQFDDRASGRSTGDVAAAYQGLIDELDPVPHDVAKIGVEGVAWYRRTEEHLAVSSGDDVYTLFNDLSLRSFLLWLAEVISGKTNELKRAPVMAAIYATFIVNEREARVFWHDVARGGAESSDDAPSTTLDAWLTKKDPTDKLKAGDYYRGCIYAWNAFRKGVNVGSIKHDKKKAAMKPSP